MSTLPREARAVVVGCGIVGNSVAYHLTRLGFGDVVLLDKGPLPSPGGSTGHASNFIYPVDHSKEMTALTLESMRQYKEMGVFTESGGIEVARTEERMQELTRRIASAKAWGVEPVSLVTPTEVKELVPFIEETVILGGFYTPSVGVVDSLQAGTIMRQRGQESGALTVLANTEVVGIDVDDGRVVKGVSFVELRDAGVGRLEPRGGGVLLLGVDDDVGAELLRHLQPLWHGVHGDDEAAAAGAGAGGGAEAQRPLGEDGGGIAEPRPGPLDGAEAGRHDVGHQDGRLVGDAVRHPGDVDVGVRRRVVLRLAAEHDTAAAAAHAVVHRHALVALAAADQAGRDDPVSRLEARHARAHRVDDTDGLVAHRQPFRPEHARIDAVDHLVDELVQEVHVRATHRGHGHLDHDLPVGRLRHGQVHHLHFAVRGLYAR